MDNKEINLNVLLNTYSIKEISGIFRDIDEKIISLHECSSEDFLALNANFKEYYKEVKVISENASHILDLISGKDNSDAFEDLTNFYEDLSNHFNFLKIRSILV